MTFRPALTATRYRRSLAARRDHYIGFGGDRGAQQLEQR
jgi:hypothetical protein